MGAGIATIFKDRFGHMDYLKSLKCRPGQVATLPLFNHRDQIDKYIFNVVTKPKSANCLPRMEEFRPAVRELAQLCVSLGVDTLAMPQIGAGLDRQPWPLVRREIEKAFEGVDTDVLIFNHPSEYPRNECRPYLSASSSAANSSPRGGEQPPPLNNQHFPHLGAPRKQKMTEADRLANDLKKSMQRKPQPSLPGRDGAFKAVKATVGPATGGPQGGLSERACAQTGDQSSPEAGATPSPPLPGEILSLSPPSTATQTANETQISAPDEPSVSTSSLTDPAGEVDPARECGGGAAADGAPPETIDAAAAAPDGAPLLNVDNPDSDFVPPSQCENITDRRKNYKSAANTVGK
jgi:Macro domain